MNEIKTGHENGYALLSALMATLLIAAMCVLAFTVSTSDLRISARIVQEKKALAAAETGIQQLVTQFNPEDLSASATKTAAYADTEKECTYKIGTPANPAHAPKSLPCTGGQLNEGVGQIYRVYEVEVLGTHTASGSAVPIKVGIGFGPVPGSPME